MAVTIAEFPSGRVFQRATTVRVSGTYTGITPTRTIGAILNGAGQQVASSDGTASGGTWHADVTVPAGGPYRARGLMEDGGWSTATQTATWYVGKLFALLGQSNAIRLADHYKSTTSALCRQSMDGATWSSSLGEGVKAFAEALYAHDSIPVGVVNGAVGGSGLNVENYDEAHPRYWLDLTAGAVYPTFLGYMGQAGSALEGVIWLQGERDAQAAYSKLASRYSEGMDTLWGRLKLDCSFPEGARIVVVPIVRVEETDTDEYGTEQSWSDVRRAQREWCAATSDAVYAGSCADATLYQVTPRIHLDQAGCTKVGARIANALINGTIGPHITGWTQTGATVEITLAHSAGADFTPTSGITGFSVIDGDAAALTVASAVRVDATTVRLTMADTTPVAAVRYLYGRNPAISAPVLDDSTLHLPLEPDVGVTMQRWPLVADMGTEQVWPLVMAAPVVMAGSGAVSTSGSCALTVARPVSGAGQVATSAACALTATPALSGTGTVAAQATCALVIPRAIAGQGTAAVSGSVALTATRAIAASTATELSASCALGVTRALTGSGAHGVTGTAALTAVRSLEAAGVAGISGSCGLTVGTHGVAVELVCAGAVDTAAECAVTVARRLTCSGAAFVGGDCALVTSRALVCTAPMAFSATGVVAIARALSGAGSITMRAACVVGSRRPPYTHLRPGHGPDTHVRVSSAGDAHVTMNSEPTTRVRTGGE